jgi:hypothetical protein
MKNSLRHTRFRFTRNFPELNHRVILGVHVISFFSQSEEGKNIPGTGTKIGSTLHPVTSEFVLLMKIAGACSRVWPL